MVESKKLLKARYKVLNNTNRRFKMGLLKKSKKVIISMALTVVLVLSGSLAAFAAWSTAYNPTSATAINSDIITVAAHRAANVSPEILGANVVATNQIGGASPYTLNDIQGASVPGTTAQENPLLKIFGSSLNENYDPYLSNFLYNSLVGSTVGIEAVNTATGGPNSADVVGSGTSATSVSLDQRPDILLGIAPNSFGTGYQDLIAGISGYDPELVNYNLTTSYDILDGLKDLAAAIDNVKLSDPSKTTRYGDPVTIASDYENYVKGLQAYIVKNINTGVVDKKSVAIVNPTPNADGTYKAYDKTVSSGTAAVCRAAEYVANTTDNVTAGKTKDADGTYHLTAADVELADVIIIAGITNLGYDGSAAKAAFEADLNSKLSSPNTKPILSSLPITAYGMFMNSADNAIGFGYYNGFIYGNTILNPTYATAYFFEQFYHVTDSTKLSAAITECLSPVLAGDGVSNSLSGYSSTNISSKILEGWNYYYANQSVFAGTEIAGWVY